jgi:hypothetical protein
MVLSKSFPRIHRWGIVTSALGNNELDPALFIGCLGSREIEIALEARLFAPDAV